MSVAIYDGVFGSMALRQVVNAGYKTDLKDAGYRFSGAVERSQSIILSGEPVIDIESMDLYTLVGSVSASVGLALASPGTITIPLQVRSSASTFVAGSSHYTLSSTLGLLVPEEVSGSQDAEAGVTVKYKLYLASSDGFTNPITINSSQALASQAFVGTYSMGPVKINGTAIAGVKNWSYKFGIKVKVDRYSGEVWPKISGLTIPDAEPEISLTFEDAASWASFGHYGALATTAAVFARQNTSGGTRTADASGAHFSATMTNGLYLLDGVDGKDTDNGQFMHRIKGHTQAFSRTATI